METSKHKRYSEAIEAKLLVSVYPEDTKIQRPIQMKVQNM